MFMLVVWLSYIYYANIKAPHFLIKSFWIESFESMLSKGLVILF